MSPRVTPEQREQRLARLPRWARMELDRLQRDLDHAHAQLAAGPEDSDTFVHTYSEPDRPLGTAPSIRFAFDGAGSEARSYVEVRLVRGRVEVRGSGSIDVRPEGSNGLTIGLVPR